MSFRISRFVRSRTNGSRPHRRSASTSTNQAFPDRAQKPPVRLLILAAFLALLCSLSSGSRTQAATTTLAVDFATQDNSSTSVGVIQSCLGVDSGASYTLDVVIQGVSDAAAAQLTLNYSGTVAARDVSQSLLNNESPDVGGVAAIDSGASDPVPDGDGSHTVVVTNDAALGSGGASGDGILIRFNMTAPVCVLPSLVPITLSSTAIGDSQANAIAHTTQSGILAVAGVPCPPPVAAPVSTPVVDANANPTATPLPPVAPQSGGIPLIGPAQVVVSNLPPPTPTSERAAGAFNLLPPSQSADFGSPPPPNVLLDPSQPSPGISGARFEGLHDSNNVTIEDPPDAQVAVGPSYVVEMVKRLGRIYSRTGVTGPGQTFSLETFFQVPSGYENFDPKVIYDAPTGHWFASYASKIDNPDPTPDEGRLHIAVSQTSDPTKTWNEYSVPSTDSFPDYPGIGLSDDKFTVSYNVFNMDVNNCPPANIGQGFCGEQTVVFQKADLLLGMPADQVRRFTFLVNGNRFDVRPAQSLSSVSDQYLATFKMTSFTTLTLIRITGTPGGPIGVTEASATDLPILRQQTVPYVEQGSSSTYIFPDNRMLDATWRDGRLWTSATADCQIPGDSERSCLHLSEVDTRTTGSACTASMPCVTQDIMAGEIGYYLTYPAVRTSVSGDLFVSFTRSNSSTFLEAGVTGRRASDPQNTMSGAALLRAGEGPYPNSRWGDYLAVAVDPSAADCAWLIGEYATNEPVSYAWGTYIAAASYTGACDGDNDSLGLTTTLTSGPCGTGIVQLKFSDCIEHFLGTDPARACGGTALPDGTSSTWPVDLNNDNTVNVTDRTKMVLQLKAYNANNVTGYNKRYDLYPDGKIDVIDRTIVALYIRATGALPCTP